MKKQNHGKFIVFCAEGRAVFHRAFLPSGENLIVFLCASACPAEVLTEEDDSSVAGGEKNGLTIILDTTE